jgi:hypothetical protein
MEVVAFDPVGLADDDAGCIVETKFLRRALSRPRQAPSDVGFGREHHTVKSATMPSAGTLISRTSYNGQWAHAGDEWVVVIEDGDAPRL